MRVAESRNYKTYSNSKKKFGCDNMCPIKYQQKSPENTTIISVTPQINTVCLAQYWEKLISRGVSDVGFPIFADADTDADFAF